MYHYIHCNIIVKSDAECKVQQSFHTKEDVLVRKSEKLLA